MTQRRLIFLVLGSCHGSQERTLSDICTQRHLYSTIERSCYLAGSRVSVGEGRQKSQGNFETDFPFSHFATFSFSCLLSLTFGFLSKSGTGILLAVFSIVDDTPSVSSDGIKYTNFGEYCRTQENRMEEETSIDQPFAEAAKRFRSLIHSKHQEVLRSSKASSLTPQDVLDLIYSAQPLCVYRSWFSRSYSDAEQDSQEKAKELRILEEVVSNWNETSGESADPEEVEKFSKKSHFLLEPESGNKRDP